MAASIEHNIALANSFSDHHAQVDPVAKAVSQNLQGPYAIKQAKHGWVFDLPTFINPKSPDYKSLSTMTGLSQQQCQQLVGFMTKNPPLDKKAMIQALQSLGISGIGDVLGEGGFRLSIETDAAYEARMQRQIRALMGSVAGGAEVLNFQEQPYQDIDKKRMRLFSRIMDSLGYTQARGLENRDVGIWVKETRKKDFTSPAKAPHLIKMVESAPFRGCILQDKYYLYLNLHVDRCKTMSELVDKLIALKNTAEMYAQQQKPALSLIIQGDMNLFMLDRTQQQRLRDAGFVVEPVKGQERYAQGTPTCEAYLRASPKLAAALSPVAAAPAFHSYPQSSSAPLPHPSKYQQPQSLYPPQYQQQQSPYASQYQQQQSPYTSHYQQQPSFIQYQQPDLNSMDLKTKKQWLQTIFTGGFIIEADSSEENRYYIVHKDKTILKNLSQSLSWQCGINGRTGDPKFVKEVPQCSCIILIDENLPQLFASDLTFDARSLASQQSSSSSASPSFASQQKSSLNGTMTYSQSGIKISVDPFRSYETRREQGGNGFTFFGGFEKQEKLAAVRVLIAAIQYYNDNQGSMAGFEEEFKLLRDFGALCEGELGTAVAQIDQEALIVILKAIMPRSLKAFTTEELKKVLGVDPEKIDGKIRKAF